MNERLFEQMEQGTVIQLDDSRPKYKNHKMVFTRFDIGLNRVYCHRPGYEEEVIFVRPEQVEKVVKSTNGHVPPIAPSERATFEVITPEPAPVPTKTEDPQAAFARLGAYEKAVGIQAWLGAEAGRTKRATAAHFGIPENQITAYLWLLNDASPTEVHRVQQGEISVFTAYTYSKQEKRGDRVPTPKAVTYPDDELTITPPSEAEGLQIGEAEDEDEAQENLCEFCGEPDCEYTCTAAIVAGADKTLHPMGLKPLSEALTTVAERVKATVESKPVTTYEATPPPLHWWAQEYRHPVPLPNGGFISVEFSIRTETDRQQESVIALNLLGEEMDLEIGRAVNLWGVGFELGDERAAKELGAKYLRGLANTLLYVAEQINN